MEEETSVFPILELKGKNRALPRYIINIQILYFVYDWKLLFYLFYSSNSMLVHFHLFRKKCILEEQ